MIAHLRELAAVLMTGGRSRRKAEWLALVCLNGGVFFRSQYLAFLGRDNPALAHRLIRRCGGAVVEEPWNGSRLRLCRIVSRPVYRALTFQAGQSMKTIEVSVLNDLHEEGGRMAAGRNSAPSAVDGQPRGATSHSSRALGNCSCGSRGPNQRHRRSCGSCRPVRRRGQASGAPGT